MAEVKTYQELAKMYNLSDYTIRVYADGYKLSKYRHGKYSLIWNDKSKAIVDTLANRKKREGKRLTADTRIKYLEEQVEMLSNLVRCLQDRLDSEDV